MAGFVVVDVLVFTVLCVVEVGHGVSGGSIARRAVAGRLGRPAASPTAAAITTGGRRARCRRSGTPGGSRSMIPTCSTPVELSDLDPPDVNAIIADPMPSVQGYSSTVDGAVRGGDRLAPGHRRRAGHARPERRRRTGRSTSSIPRSCSPRRSTWSPAPPGAARRPGRRAPGGATLAAGQRATWYLGGASRCPGSRCRTPPPGRTRRPGFSSGSPHRTARRSGSARGR